MTFDELFALEQTGDRTWTAPGAPATDEDRLFGGVLIGQAILAASANTRRCHALHAFFIGVGAKQAPCTIDVDATRDGGSFATRRFEIRQDDRLLLAGHSSHHDGDDGPRHQDAMPDLPQPESLPDQRDLRLARAREGGKPERAYLAEQMLDIRPVSLPGGLQAGRAVWVRPREPVQGGLAMQQAAIGFASDAGLVHVGLQTHPQHREGKLQAASLDHSLWFHEAATPGAWLLFVQHSPAAMNGRGLSFASVFCQDGRLVASVAQEFLARRRRG